MNPYSTVPGVGHHGARPAGVRWLRLLLLTDVPERIASQGAQMRTNVTSCSSPDYHGLRGGETASSYRLGLLLVRAALPGSWPDGAGGDAGSAPLAGGADAGVLAGQ